MPSNRARNAYMTNAVACAPPERLVTMLYDGLVNYILAAEKALEDKDFFTLNDNLLRAEEIVLYLSATLKTDVWEGAPALLSIYNYVYQLLVRGNVHKDAGALSEARKHVEPLQAAWHAAADKVLAERAGNSASAGTGALAGLERSAYPAAGANRQAALNPYAAAGGPARLGSNAQAV
jgi:flagellar protein FliS